MDALNETLSLYFRQQGPFLTAFLPDRRVAPEWQESSAHFLLAAATHLKNLQSEKASGSVAAIDPLIHQIEDDTTAIMKGRAPFAPAERLCENLRTAASFVLRTLPLPTTRRPRSKVVTLYPALSGLPKDMVAAHLRAADAMETATRQIDEEAAIDPKAFARAVNVKLAEHLREMSDDLAERTGQPLLHKKPLPRRARVLPFTATP